MPAPHEVRRERLLEVLHRHSMRPLLLLVAPAGFGKTTLAASYARDSGAVVAWMRLDASDRDSRVFFSHLADILEAAFAQGDLLPRLREGLLQGAEGLGLARLLVADLQELSDGFILVLDDYHAVHDAEEVHESLDALVAELPEEGQIVVTAREMPPLAGTALVATDRVFALGADDLRFSPEEVAELRLALGGDASHDGQAEGWVAGILLGGAPRQLGAVGGSLLESYVDREVLARLRPSEQRWLQTLCVVEAITPRAAEAVAGKGPWPGRLAALTSRCPFLVPDEDGSYRLHALIRETLLNRLRRQPVRAARTWLAARRLAERDYDMVALVRACEELGDLDDAVTLVRRSVEEAMRPGRWAAALATLELLPVAMRRAHPDLSIAEAHALLLLGRPEPAQQAAEASLEGAGRSGDVTAQIEAIIELARIGRWTGNLPAAEDWLAAGDYLLLNSQLPTEKRRILEGRSLGVRGTCLAVRGQVAEARELFERAEQVLAPLGVTRDRAIVLDNLGVVLIRAGESSAAAKALSSARKQWRVIGDRAYLATVEVLLGSLELRRGALDRAGIALSDALRSSRLAGAVRTELHALASLGAWHRANGRMSEAAWAFEESLRLAEHVNEREPTVEALRMRAEIAIVQGDLPHARLLLSRAHAEGQLLESSFQLACVERALGRLHLAEGAARRAVRDLEEAWSRGKDVFGPDEQMVTLYWRATACLVTGRAADAERFFAEALGLAEQADALEVLAGPAGEDARMLQHAMHAGRNLATLGRLEKLATIPGGWHEDSAQPVRLLTENKVPQIEIRLFGTRTIYRDGKIVDVGPRGGGRSQELLAFLALHPDGCPAHAIAGELWSGMPAARALHNLQMAAYGVRRVLGSKISLSSARNVYRLSPEVIRWVDVREFDQVLATARAAPLDVLQLLERAVELYRGPLLFEEDWPWAATLRSTYQTRSLQALSRLADLLADSEPERSDRLADNVLRQEPLHEAAHLRLIENARRRGDSLAEARLAERYRRAWELAGMTPNESLILAMAR